MHYLGHCSEPCWVVWIGGFCREGVQPPPECVQWWRGTGGRRKGKKRRRGCMKLHVYRVSSSHKCELDEVVGIEG